MKTQDLSNKSIRIIQRLLLLIKLIHSEKTTMRELDKDNINYIVKCLNYIIKCESFNVIQINQLNKIYNNLSNKPKLLFDKNNTLIQINEYQIYDLINFNWYNLHNIYSNVYLAIQKASELKIGDIVTIMRAAKRREFGWANSWHDDMTDCIGQNKKYIIESMNETGVFFKDIKNSSWGFSFPIFVLKKI